MEDKEEVASKSTTKNEESDGQAKEGEQNSLIIISICSRLLLEPLFAYLTDACSVRSFSSSL